MTAMPTEVMDSARTITRVSAVAAACIVGAALATPCRAADIGPANRWLEWENNHAVMGEAMKRCEVSPQLAAQWDQKMQQLAQRIAKTEVSLAQGSYGDLRGILHGPDNNPLPCKSSPLTGDIALAVWPAGRLPLQPGQTQPKRPGPGGGEGSGPSPSLRLYLNERQGTDEVDWLKDGAGPRMTAGHQSGTVLGYPVWGKNWLIVTPPNRPPPFLPAPLERVVKAWVAKQNADLDQVDATLKLAEAAKDKSAVDMFTKLIEVNRPRIEKVRKQLDGSPAQLKGPVFIGGRAEVQAEATPDAQQVWIDNPATFDPKLPRSAVQVIAIDIATMNFDQPGGAQGDAKWLGRQFIERIDWKALAEEGLK
jgi:hypothetical protein